MKTLNNFLVFLVFSINLVSISVFACEEYPPIMIDGEHLSTYDDLIQLGILSGQGTKSDPYEIFDLCITGRDQDTLISIKNFNKHLVISENYLSHGQIGILVQDSFNITIENNVIQNLEGQIPIERGSDGKPAIGIQVINVISAQILDNEIENIHGGRGKWGNYGEKGGNGGVGVGIWIFNVNLTSSQNNQISNIFGGLGGAAGVSIPFIKHGGSGGSGGAAVGFFLVKTSGNITNNYLNKIYGVAGAPGAPGAPGLNSGDGGNGGNASGIILIHSEDLKIEHNTILEVNNPYTNNFNAHSISSAFNLVMTMVNGFIQLDKIDNTLSEILTSPIGAPGAPAFGLFARDGIDGVGGSAFGITLLKSNQIQIIENEISGLYGGIGGIGNFYRSYNNTGGKAVGIWNMDSSNYESKDNQISDLVPGDF